MNAIRTLAALSSSPRNNTISVVSRRHGFDLLSHSETLAAAGHPPPVSVVGEVFARLYENDLSTHVHRRTWIVSD